MVGVVAQMSNRIGGYSFIEREENNLKIKIPAGSKVLCTNCVINDESDLLSESSIIKTDVGYDVLKAIDTFITKEDTVPLSIIRGREILYVEGAINSTTTIAFNLPKGSRVNQTLVENTGEITIPVDTKYLIEY